MLERIGANTCLLTFSASVLKTSRTLLGMMVSSISPRLVAKTRSLLQFIASIFISNSFGPAPQLAVVSAGDSITNNAPCGQTLDHERLDRWVRKGTGRQFNPG